MNTIFRIKYSFLLFLFVGNCMGANVEKHEVNYGEILNRIVSETMLIMRNNGYDMPNYLVRQSKYSSGPVSGPPEKHAFFAYIDSGLVTKKQKIMISMYEADKLSIEARAEWVNYILRLHHEVEGGFNLELCLTKSKYKKPQIVMPGCFARLVMTQI